MMSISVDDGKFHELTSESQVSKPGALNVGSSDEHPRSKFQGSTLKVRTTK
jgi:hypothetical protein